MEFLGDTIEDILAQLDSKMHYFLKAPFNYPQDIVDEVIDILDRIGVLFQKLDDEAFQGDYRYSIDE